MFQCVFRLKGSFGFDVGMGVYERDSQVSLSLSLRGGMFALGPRPCVLAAIAFAGVAVDDVAGVAVDDVAGVAVDDVAGMPVDDVAGVAGVDGRAFLGMDEQMAWMDERMALLARMDSS